MCNLMIEFNQRGRELVTHGADVRVRLMKHASSYSMVTRMTTMYVLKQMLRPTRNDAFAIAVLA